jgi:hypothetical protein
MNPVNIGRTDVVAAGGIAVVEDGTVTDPFKNSPMYVDMSVVNITLGIILIVCSKFL